MMSKRDAEIRREGGVERPDKVARRSFAGGMTSRLTGLTVDLANLSSAVP